MRNRLFILSILTALLTASSTCLADTIYLKSGKTVEGQIIFESDIFVRIKTGQISTEEYLRPHIDRIERGEPDQTDVVEEPVVKAPPADDPPVSVETTATAGEDAEPGTIKPYQKVLSLDSPTPNQSAVFIPRQSSTAPTVQPSSDSTFKTRQPRSNRASRTSRASQLSSSYAYTSAETDQTAYQEPDYAELAEQMKASVDAERQAMAAQQQSMMQAVANAPNIYNTESYNAFLDQTITTSPTLKGGTRMEPRGTGGYNALAMPRMASATDPMEKAREFFSEVIIPVVIGIAVPVLLGFVLLIVNIVQSTSKRLQTKKIDEEIAGLDRLKTEGKVTVEEHANLVGEVKKKLTESELKTYLQTIPHVLVYPLRGKVIFSTIGAGVVFYVFQFALMAPFYGFFAMIFGFCYIVACICKIIETAVSKDDANVFEWPGYTEMVDWFGKAFLFIVGWLICHGTAILVFIGLFRFEAIRPVTVALSVALFVIGVFVYPMYIMSMSLVGGAASLNIINILRAISSTFVSYTLTLFVLMLTQVLDYLAHLIPVIFIPMIGGVFRWFLFAYFLIVDMRLLGIFYKTHRMTFRWFGEDEDDE